MLMADSINLALIDDDDAVLDALRRYLARHKIVATGFRMASEFLAALERGERFECVVSDIRMPGMSGLDLVHTLGKRGFAQPIVLITAHGDVAMAVSAIKDGAFDFIEKPFDEAHLLASVRQAVEKSRQDQRVAAEIEDLRTRFNALSARQRQVMELAVAGLSSKEIGMRLGISTKTVENHRAWIMERTGARNLAELIRMAMKWGSRSIDAPGEI
jgi:RNA polymerase sigma factor (sigma-70 family)